MFSKLSAGGEECPCFNQAARNVACIAEVLRRANKPPAEFSALGFYVLAPASQIQQRVFAEHLGKDSLRQTVQRRVSKYGGKRDTWFSDWFLSACERLDVRAVAWEDTKRRPTARGPMANDWKAFYEKCLEFNKPPVNTENAVRDRPEPGATRS